MAYEFSPDQDVAGPSVSDGDGGRVIEFAIGFDTESDLIVLMAVMLTRTDRIDTLELHFGIRTRIGDGPASAPDYSKEAADSYIPKEGRTSILDLIRQCVMRVVADISPSHIVMETYYGHLPPKALAKYAPIGAAVIVCGYKVADQWRDPQSGINYWVFSRTAGTQDTKA